MHDYQRLDTSMTLAEGLQEYYAVHDNVTPPAEHRPEAAALFANHDVGHVVFGTTTNLLDEARTDTWILFGCDVGFRGYAGYFELPEAKEAFATVGWGGVLASAWPITRAMWDVWRRTRRMHKKWPWVADEALRQRSLPSLRAEWGIEVVTGTA